MSEIDFVAQHNAGTPPAVRVALEALAADAPLPWSADRAHPGQILDAENGLVGIVDPDRFRSDADARALAALIVGCVNAAARQPGPQPEPQA